MGNLFSSRWKSQPKRVIAKGEAMPVDSKSDQFPISESDTYRDYPIIKQWKQEQEELKKKLIIIDDYDESTERLIDSDFGQFNYIGGVDISFVKGDPVNACAAFIILNCHTLEVVYEDLQMIQLTAPYIPGYLAFRETPDLVRMINKVKKNRPEIEPDVIMVDGNGILHPRRFGLACHLGVMVDIPCLGVAKTLFHVDGIENNKAHKARINEMDRGGYTFELIGDSGQLFGMALRSCDTTINPIYISVGHKISLQVAVALVHKCCKYRIPEPTRQADIRSRDYLRKHFNE